MVNGACPMALYSRDFFFQRGDARVELLDRQWVEVLARDTLEMPVRIGSPQGIGGLMDQIGNPAFSTSIGLLLWGAHHLGEEPIGYASGNGMNPLSRVGEWVRNLFPG